MGLVVPRTWHQELARGQHPGFSEPLQAQGPLVVSSADHGPPEPQATGLTLKRA